MKYLAIITTAIIASHSSAYGKCLTKSEARIKYNNTHLFWSVGPNGKCWETSLARARIAAKNIRASAALPSPPPAPKPSIFPNPGDPVIPILLHEPPKSPPQKHIEDSPQWAWVTRARAHELETEIIYSTFNGEPPDVWPQLESPKSKNFLPSFLFVIIVILALMAAFKTKDCLVKFPRFENGRR